MDDRLGNPIAALKTYQRAVLILIAFLGTALYSTSFLLHPDRATLLRPGIAVGIAAGISWLILGLALLASSGWSWHRVKHWFDSCLIAMAFGEIILLTAALANALAAALVLPALGLSAHGALLLAADLVMAVIFIVRARSASVPARVSLTYWLLVLNGTFAIQIVTFFWFTEHR